MVTHLHMRLSDGHNDCLRLLDKLDAILDRQTVKVKLLPMQLLGTATRRVCVY